MQITLFVTNLHNPSHMEWTKDGRLLVSEHSAGRIKDVTGGGDMSDAKIFASGLKGPASILPLKDGRILISESWGGTIKDISNGGDMTEQEPFATGLSIPYSLVSITKSDGSHIYVSESDASREAWISDVTSGGVRTENDKYVRDMPVMHGSPGVTPLESWPDRWEEYASSGCVKDWQDEGRNGAHYVALGGLGQIMDVSPSGGMYIDIIRQKKLLAWGLHPIGGMKRHPKNDLLYVCEPLHGMVMAIDAKAQKNYTFEPPVVRGLQIPTCLRFSPDGETMYVCSQGHGVIWKITDF